MVPTPVWSASQARGIGAPAGPRYWPGGSADCKAVECPINPHLKAVQSLHFRQANRVAIFSLDLPSHVRFRSKTAFCTVNPHNPGRLEKSEPRNVTIHSVYAGQTPDMKVLPGLSKSSKRCRNYAGLTAAKFARKPLIFCIVRHGSVKFALWRICRPRLKMRLPPPSCRNNIRTRLVIFNTAPDLFRIMRPFRLRSSSAPAGQVATLGPGLFIHLQVLTDSPVPGKVGGHGVCAEAMH